MNVSAPLEVKMKVLEVVEPRVSPFNHPAEFPQAAALFRTTLGDYRLDAAFAKSLMMPVRIVATIGIDDLRLLKWPVSHATKPRDRVNQRRQLGEVVATRTVQDRADGNVVCVDEEVMFGTGSYDSWSLGQFFTRANGLYQTGIDRNIGEVDLASFAQLIEPLSVPPVPRTSLLLGVPPSPAGCARAKAQYGRWVVPSEPRPQHEREAIQRRPIQYAWATRILFAPWLGRRQLRFD